MPRSQVAVATPAERSLAHQLALVHHVRYDEPGRKRAKAMCGTYVDRHAQRGAVTCGACLEEIAHHDSLDFGTRQEELAVTHPFFAGLPADEPESDEPSAPADVVTDPQTIEDALRDSVPAVGVRGDVLRFPAAAPPTTVALIVNGVVGPLLIERVEDVPEWQSGIAVTEDPPHADTYAHVDRPRPTADATLVAFPLLADGETRLSFDRLADPARQVAELVERLEPVLAPPTVVANLELLVLQANAVNVVDAASYQRAVALYEELAANEKGIEESIGPVVAFFHRPWKALTSFRARFAKPVADAKKRLSETAGAWKLADDRRVATEQREAEELLQREERERLQALATEAAKQKKPELAAAATAASEQVARPVLPAAAFSPTTAATGTGNRKSAEAVVIDEDAFYKGLADGTIPRSAAPIDQAWLNRQAKDLPKDEFEKRYPGTQWKQTGGLTARGRR